MGLLPIFPLKTVLFPGIPLRLHIFEPRYKKMLKDCLERESPFGVCLIAKGEEAHGPLAEPHRIGCTAKIDSLKPHDNGRINLMAIGGDRFRILELQPTSPYLQARTEKLKMSFEADQGQWLAQPLSDLLPQYLHRLRALDLWQGNRAQIPSEPMQLAYLCAAVLRLPKSEKQELLAMNRARVLFRELESHLRREIALLQPLADRGVHRLEESSPLN